MEDKGNSIVYEKQSFDISIPNIDIQAYIKSQQDKTKNYSAKNPNMLSEESIQNILILYPELKDLKLDEWTYDKYNAYDRMETEKKYQPSKTEAFQLADKGIILSDAIRLKSIYGSYQDLLKADIKELKSLLEDIYLRDLESAQNLVVEPNILSDTVSTRGPVTPPDNSTTYTYKVGGDNTTYLKYYWCNLSGYKSDWFIVDSETHKYDNNITYGAGANLLFKALYDTTSSYSSESMWGSYSDSRHWPHEAIDFDFGRGEPIYAPFSNDPTVSGDAVLYLTDDYYGRIVYTCGTGYNAYTVSLQHTGYIEGTTHRISSSTFSSGDPIGTESGYGSGSGPYDFTGSHTHISVRKGTNYTWDIYDDELNSDNPYIYAFRHF